MSELYIVKLDGQPVTDAMNFDDANQAALELGSEAADYAAGEHEVRD